MIISTFKQDYIVKSILFLSFLGFISLGLIGGCSDGGGQNDPQALTENDFAEDSSLRAELDEGVVVTFLESPGSEEAEDDTGTIGKDDIPVTYDETTEQTFCWEDEDPEAMHFMELRDTEGSLILTVHVNGDCVTEVIEAGDYVISIYHDESVGEALPIFLIPDPEETEQARNAEGFIDRINVAAANILGAIQKTVTKDALAQTVMVNISTLVSTRSCVGCNLEGADLFDRRLSGVNLSSANLSNAGLRGAILTGANLSSANLSGANMRFARMSGANLTSAVLLNANLSSADLTNVIFINADLRRANLNDTRSSGAIFTDSNMIGTRLNGANLTNADLSGTELSVAEFHDANLTGANLSNADSRGAFFRRTNLSGADLTDADFRFVNFTNANLTGVTLSNTDFSFATWCTGTCSCSENSIDTCVGCTPIGLSAIDFCTGP